jgi:hypothetical protein
MGWVVVDDEDAGATSQRIIEKKRPRTTVVGFADGRSKGSTQSRDNGCNPTVP